MPQIVERSNEVLLRARFQCIRCENIGEGDNEIQLLKFIPVEDPENSDWSKAVPTADMTMRITERAAFDTFKFGQHYFLDFLPIEVPSA